MRTLSIASISALALGALTLGLTQFASAADLAVKSPPPVPVAPAWSWTGFYVGGNLGYSTGGGTNQNSNASLFSAAGVFTMSSGYSLAPSGVIGGGQVGYNWQFSPHGVVGIEWDFDGTGQRDSACGIAGTSCPGGVLVNGINTLSEKLDWLTTVRGRLGWAQDGWLAYVTGGGAWGKVDTNFAFNCPGGCGSLGGATTGAANFSDTKGGWTIGGGVELRLVGNWTGKVEYLYAGLGTLSHTLVGAPTATFFVLNDKIQDNIFRAGVNYKFY